MSMGHVYVNGRALTTEITSSRKTWSIKSVILSVVFHILSFKDFIFVSFQNAYEGKANTKMQKMTIKVLRKTNIAVVNVLVVRMSRLSRCSL